MGRIRVLSDQVANKIAAGEVVERPASVVKELIENSLDADANEFRVEIESGGRRLIRVADDGGGMLRDDAMLAFERHATSKLRDVKDLLSIATLGFRGEALPSIAAVSRLALETRAREEPTGTRVEIAGGKMLRSEETALAPGTAVTVRDLFFNVPARKKFLRSEQTEMAHIASLVTHYSLAHPGKTWRLSSGANELLCVTPVASLRERVYQVFGSQVMDELVELGPAERQLDLSPPVVAPSEAVAAYQRQPEEPALKTFRLRGFVSRPHVHKSNRNSIFIFVNGRLIRDRLLMHALSAAYQNLMPASAFPFALLFLECDYDEVDVNVHPSKTEVRFRHQSFVHDFIRDAIRQQMIESRPASSFRFTAAPQPAAQLPYSEFSQMMENQAAADSLAPPALSEARPLVEPGVLPEYTLRSQPGPQPRLELGVGTPVVPELPVAPPAPPARMRMPDTHGAFPAEVIVEMPASLAVLSDLRPLGQIYDSFIVAAGRDGLWIIDQHVAHERILFERVLKQIAAGRVEVQQLLMPMIIPLTIEQQTQYERISGELHAAGFEVEPFGNRTVAVKAAPAALPAGELERVLFEVMEIAEHELRSYSMEELHRAVAASIACRAAIKINMRLEPAKIDWLLSALAATENPMSCPHGRPIALRYSGREILKSFHRI